MKKIQQIKNHILVALLLTIGTLSYASTPLWTFTPLTATKLSVPSNDTATVQYTVTNQSNRVHTLNMQSVQGITQVTTGLGVCGNPFILTAKASCTLTLEVNGSQLNASINDGPLVCEQNSTRQCYQPEKANILHITQTNAITNATITVTSSPLTLPASGSTGTLTINNTSLIVTATNITADFTGTALAGLVTQTASTCTSVPPGGSCTLTFSPGDTAVSQTNFRIQGDNTNVATGAITISDSLTTLFSGGNDQRGNIFNVTNLSSSPITITSFDINLQPGTGQLIVYYLEHAATGFETDPTPWHTLGTATVMSNGNNIATPLPVGGLTIPAGATYGIYITENASVTPRLNYTNGANMYTNNQLSIQSLTGRMYPPFSAPVFSPRRWNGTIYYN